MTTTDTVPEGTTTPEGDPTLVQPTESELLQSIKADPVKTEEFVLKLRKENETRRQKETELSEALKKIEDDKVLEQNKKLAEDGEFKKLLEASDLRITDLSSQIAELTDVKTKYDGIEARNNEILLKELEGLDKDMADLITNSTMETIDKIEKARKFKDAKAIKSNPGTTRTGGPGVNNEELTALGNPKPKFNPLVTRQIN